MHRPQGLMRWWVGHNTPKSGVSDHPQPCIAKPYILYAFVLVTVIYCYANYAGGQAGFSAVLINDKATLYKDCQEWIKGIFSGGTAFYLNIEAYTDQSLTWVARTGLGICLSLT